MEQQRTAAAVLIKNARRGERSCLITFEAMRI